jgi:hypothetical protein
VIHKNTFLADLEWRQVLSKALENTGWGNRPLEDMVVNVFAAAKGVKDGAAWLTILEMVDGTKPVIAIKHREGEIPPEERARVPGNNLAFLQSIGSGQDGVYSEHLGGFGWLCGDREFRRLGIKHSLNHRRLWRRLLAPVCNRRGLECQRRAVLTIGDLWYCKKHAPTTWPALRESILKTLVSEAAWHERAAAKAASMDGPNSGAEVQTQLHIADALRRKHRVLSKRRCWTMLAPKEAVRD